MNRWLTGIVAGIVASTTISGCDFSDSSIQMMATGAGTVASIAWIAIDNPDDEAKAVVSGVLSVIKDNAVIASTNEASYSDVINPIIEKYVDESTEIKPQYKAIAKVGARFILLNIDTFLDGNAEWKEKEELSLKIVNAFVGGAQAGMALSKDDPRIIRAVKSNRARARIYKQ